MKKLTHLDNKGNARMVDVGAKKPTLRYASAAGEIRTKPETIEIIMTGRAKKGDVFTAAKLAGIMAAKRTSELIPLCHGIALNSISIDFNIHKDRITVTADSSAFDRTGVEMEAMTAVSVACLTIYDMAKTVDRGMEIGGIRLLKKTGGRSGTYERK